MYTERDNFTHMGGVTPGPTAMTFDLLGDLADVIKCGSFHIDR